ncbi:MAG TPA: 50S ribosomal protein L3 [Methylothermaceae bacterium]|nr:50S ribosomal protein L3 [Methylothermaceae bacterium]
MTIGVVGRKCGMTRVFAEDGRSIPVTVIQVEENRITQLRTLERDGYRAVQVTTGTKKPSRLTKPAAGHFAKAGVEPGRGLWEFRLEEGEGEDLQVGGTVGIDMFSEGQYVDVVGTTLGKGFAGTIKRHHFNSQDASHGNSLSHRVPGSIGQCQTPGRVFKGKRMAGHMGNVRRTVQNLQIVAIDKERNLLLIKGAVPGYKGADVVVRPAVKAKKD